MKTHSRREKEKAKARRKSAREWADEQDKGFEPTTVKLPEGTDFLKLRIGVMRIDVIPYVVGKGNPNADEGMLHFERRYDVHRLPLPNGKAARYICPYETFGKPCPVCQWVAKNGGTADKKLLEDLRVQRRHLFNVIDVTDESEAKKGIQVLDTTFGSVKYPSFGKMLKDKLQVSEKYESFDDPEDGMTVHVKVEEDKLPGGKFNRVTNIDFIDRKKQHDPDIIEKAVCLDDTLIELPFDELQGILEQRPGNAERDGKAPKGKAPAEEEDEDQDEPDEPSETEDEETIEYEKGDMVKHKKLGVCKVVKVSSDGNSLTLEDEEGDSHPAIDPDDVVPAKGKAGEEDEDEDEEDSETEDEEDDEEDDDEDEEDSDEDEPPKKKKLAAKKRR